MGAEEWCLRCEELEYACGIAEAVERRAMDEAALKLEAEGSLQPELLHQLASASLEAIRARVRWLAHALAEPDLEGG